ncbi:MAG: uridine kinase [Gemmiger sp.]
MPTIQIPKRLVSCELIDLAANDPAAFVAMCENRYNARIEAAVQQISAHGARLVMLTGPSSSGKTTSSYRLAQAIRDRGRQADVISLDDFFVGAGRYPKQLDGSDDYECPEALDLPQLQDCLLSLLNTGRCSVPKFDFVTQQPSGEYRTVECTDGVVIIEGLHALNPRLTEQLPPETVFRVYTSLSEEYCDDTGRRTLCTRDIRLARRIVRDGLFRGHGADFTLDLWSHVCASEDRYIRVYKKSADLVLDTSFSYEVCIWEKLLMGIEDTLAPGSRNERNFRRLCGLFRAFTPLSEQLVPQNSILREFIGQN